MRKVLNTHSLWTTFYKANPNFASLTCLQRQVSSSSLYNFIFCYILPSAHGRGHYAWQRVLRHLLLHVALRYIYLIHATGDVKISQVLMSFMSQPVSLHQKPHRNEGQQLGKDPCTQQDVLSVFEARGGSVHIGQDFLLHITPSPDHLYRWDHLTSRAQTTFPQKQYSAHCQSLIWFSLGGKKKKKKGKSEIWIGHKMKGNLGDSISAFIWMLHFI